MNSIVTQRFIKCHDKLREENKIRSSRQFALSLEYLPQSLSEILRGRRDVTIELLRKAVEKYKINPIYIFTGEGPMFLKEESNRKFRVLTIVTNMEDEERIVHVPAPAHTGYASESDNPSFVQNLPQFSLPDYKYKAGTHRSFDVAGDSMSPTLLEGDKIVCSFLEPTLWENGIKNDYVYVLVTPSDVLIRRVKNELKASKQLILHSDNTYYQPQVLSMSELSEVWYVKTKIAPFLPAFPENNLQYNLNNMRETLHQQSQLIRRLQESIENMRETT